MTDITLRQTKGAPLTHDELDANFANLKETADLAYDASVAIGGKANASALGVDDAATDLGTFTGSTISDNATAKGALQELETALESASGSAATKTNATAIGIAATDADMGNTPGTILTDNATAKDWFEELEEAAERAILNLPTLGDMVAHDKLFIGQVVRTSGYFVPGDGGGAQYEIAAPASSAPVPAGSDPYVIVGTGQSNAVGYSGATGGVFPRNDKVFMWLALTDGGVPQWVQDPDFASVTYYVPIPATATYHALGGGKSNPLFALAHRTQIEVGRPVYAVLDGLGGRPISEWVGTGSVRYASLRANVIAALAAIPGGAASAQLVCWQQGEADVALGTSAYQAALNTVYSQLAAEPFWTAKTHFIAGKLNPANGTYAVINAAIDAFAAEDPSVRHVAETSGLAVHGDNVHFIGIALYELGFTRYWNALANVGMPDTGSRILLDNGLISQLHHNGVIRGEWFGCVGGLESSARLNDVNNFAMLVRALPGYNAVTVTQDAYVTIKDPVLFGTGSTTSGDMIQYHIKLNGRIFVAAGGLLEADSTRYALTFSGFDTSRLDLPFMRMNYYCNGVKIAGYIRGIVSGGSISRAAETSIDVSGTCSGTNFYSLRAYQRSATDDQSLLTGYALTVDTEDVAFYGGQIGIAKWPIWIYGTASGCHFMRMHVHNGSTTMPRVDVATVVNDGVFNIRFENAYFDDGYVVDRTGSLGVTNCLHFYNSAWATLTHPLMRVNVGSGSALTTVVDDYRGTLGHYSGGDYMVLDALSNGSTTATATYTDGSSRASMGGTNVMVPYPKPSETETVVQEYSQWYDIGTASHFVMRWINRYGAGGSTNVAAWDWDKDTLRLRTPSRGTATPGLFLGGGFIGMQATNSQADLLLGSASAARWRINDTSGSLIPEADNTAFVGTATNRASRMYANRFYPGAGATFVTSGAGTPEGAVTSSVGSMYLRTDGGAGTTLYIKESGTGSTGWVAK